MKKTLFSVLFWICLLCCQLNSVFAVEPTEEEKIVLEASKYFDMHDHAKFAELYQKLAGVKKVREVSFYNWATSLEERRAYKETIIMLKIYLERTGKLGVYYKEATSLLEKTEANYKLQLEDEKKHSNVPSDYKSMIHVSAGKFKMGSEKANEKPPHAVSLKGYYIGKYEVTQKLWKEIMGYNPSMYIGDARPVDSVNWYDAVEFCNKLSIKEGLTPCYDINKDKRDPNNRTDDSIKWTVTCDFSANGYRLPTEAEWEFAARGGISSKGYVYSGSNKLTDVTVLYKDSDKSKATNTVGSKKPNELGIYDMTGNVSEWCWDWFSWAYYKESPADNPKGAHYSVEGRVARGGSLLILELRGCVSNRSVGGAIDRSYTKGIRLARSEGTSE